MRPLMLEYPDDMTAVDQNDEYFFGNDLLVAPITKDDDSSRRVYLPSGVWYDFWTDRRYTGPVQVEVAAPMERLPLFVRGGAIIPSQQEMQYTGEASIDPLTLDVYPAGTSSRPYYEDDGISFDYQHGVSLRQTLTAKQEANGVRVEISAREGSFTPPQRSLVIKVHGQRTQPQQVTVAGRDFGAPTSLKALQGASEGWAYEADGKTAWLKTLDRGTALTVQVVQ